MSTLAVSHDELEAMFLSRSRQPTPDPSQPRSHPSDDSEGQALESHEVIELQTFSERKAWIEEKIKFLEKLPPIEVFVGLDALRNSAEEVPGLPTREQLQQWVDEHDFIEKETEVFDKGELKKLRQITKAATQRNLSPEDTDLIELTLTTIYALDKLLHLLRDRSENLDLLGIRLDWEEHRTASWVERGRILGDLESFLATRARWSPSVYEITPQDSPVLSRRASVTSLSTQDSYSLSNPAFARSARFKLAEQLSRDAAQFGARVANLSHGRVATAGRMLDKLIDHSRRPVPDVLLDEQDRLEERGINQMENVGKFVLSLVMQWRKADDTYVETLKDQDAAKDLEEEIATARLSHPTFRQSSQFSARVDTLLKRLSVRVNPTSKVSGFPRPEHPLFPKQAGENESLANFLSAEITTATELVQKVEAAAKEYRDNWEAVRRTEIVVTGANELSETLTSIVERLSQGVPTEAEDGSPPDLSTSDCLQPNRHSLFLALLPSIQAEAARAVEKAIEITKQSQLAFYALDSDSVDPIFTSNASESIRRLIALKDQCQNHLNTANQQVTRLREARQIWTAMDTNLKELQCLRDDIVHLMERDSWKQAAIGHGAPPTPETPTVELTPITPAPEPTNLDAELQSIDSRLAETVDAPLRALTPTLDPNALQECLTTKASSVRAYHEGLLRMNRMLKTIQTQSSVMAGVRDEYNTILIRIEDAKAHLSALTDNVLGYDDSISDLPLSQASAKSELEDIHLEAATFIDSLSSRVPFLSALGAVSPAPGRTTFRRPSQSSVETEVEDPLANLPLDPGKLDAAVREDSNTFVMRLRGSLETVGKATRQLEVAQLGKFVDGKVESASKAVAEIEDRLSEHADLMKTLPIPDPGSQGDGLVQQINSILAKVEELSETRGHISRCFSPIRDLLRKMDTSSHDFEPAVRQSLFTSRLRITENVEGRFKAWFQGLNILKDTLSAKIVEELERLEKERRGTEERARDEKEKEVKEEQQRREREEEDRAREEKRRREEEERAERARLEEARRRDEEAQAERARLEKEAIQEEDRQRAEEKARLEAERARETRDLLTQNEVDKARLLQERKDIEAKLRQAEALLQEERRLQAERERLAAARTLLEKSQIQEEATQRLLAEQKTRDELLKADADRLQAAEGETKRLQRELEFIKAEHKRTLSEREVLARQQRESQHRKKPSVIEDVFSIGGPSDLRASATDEERQYQALIFDLRKRLRSLSINELARPSKGKKSSPSALPTADQVTTLRRKFSAIIKQTAELPESIPNLGIDADLRSLRMELESSEQLMDDIENLLRLSELVSKCDTALSDLLEHIDSYPAPPLIVSDLYTIDETSSPPEQLVGRVAFTRGAIDEMQVTFNRVCNDARARSERTRIVQTWLELEEMANDRLGGRKSRPGSVSSVHSGRLSSASMASSMASYRGPGMMAKKRTSYSNLSVSVNIKDGKLAPPGPAHPSSRRVVSTGPGEKKEHRRSSSRQSISTSRSVSGPGPTISAAVGTTPRPFNASIMGSTFASRQRTGSVSSLSGTPTSGRTGTGTPVQRARAQGQAQPGRHRSPSVTDTPIRQSFGASAPPRTKTTSGSTWSRAPRNSLSSIVPTRTLTPQKPKGVPAGAPRKKYVADPKNKLDVAVGEVINQLSVGINVEGVAETWRDQSGKYWIGNQDPKLCFCRILRSQTVMVRVGGGWQELSKFIKDHFAESFRLLPESSPPEKLQEEKWISSVTLLMEKPELTTPASPPRLPKTPEPQIGFVPSFAIVTPSGHSPRSILSSPGSNKGSSGSPLTPMQFMRRADADPTLLRPGTPSKTPTGPRQRTQAVAPSALGSVWRP